MDKQKICFILCVNQEVFYEECCFYLSRLFVPENYSVEVKAVWGAASMAAGYNQAMKETDAAYKVFLHQDVFIINRYFIINMLELFGADESIGMIGMVGAEKLAGDGIMWHSFRCGNVYGSDVAVADIPVNEYRYDLLQDGYTKVEAVDGFLMAVREEIPWREDLLDGWDFYDVSQSLEYRRRGKKVVVPKQKRPWCIHNDGILNMENYETYRKIVLEEYKDLLVKGVTDEA